MQNWYDEIKFKCFEQSILDEHKEIIYKKHETNND